VTPEGQFPFSIGHKSLAFLISVLQELGQRLLANSEEMERRMAEKLQAQIEQFNEKIWRLDSVTAVCAGLEDNRKLKRVREPESPFPRETVDKPSTIR